MTCSDTRVICKTIRRLSPLFKISLNNNFQVKKVIATGGTVGLAEWTIDDTHVCCQLDLFLILYNLGQF